MKELDTKTVYVKVSSPTARVLLVAEDPAALDGRAQAIFHAVDHGDVDA